MFTVVMDDKIPFNLYYPQDCILIFVNVNQLWQLGLIPSKLLPSDVQSVPRLTWRI